MGTAIEWTDETWNPVTGCTKVSPGTHMVQFDASHSSTSSEGPKSEAGIAWVIVGGESGPGARPMDPDWARSLRDQCVAAGVPFFFKQWGEWAEASKGEATHLLARYGVPKAGGARNEPACIPIADGTMDYPYGLRSGTNVDLVDRGHDGWVRMRRIGRTRAGRQLDERTWDEYPKGEG